ncbi:hypothetical protein MauCBS54593_007489 [Microsporum audouinii]
MLSPCRLLHASNRRLSTILHTRKLSQTLYQRGADTATYRWIEDVEELERYQPGGYHPVSIGDVLAGRYQIEHKLGHGGFSTIWLARDIRYKKGYVALKINTADSSSQESEVLLALAQSDHPCRVMIPLIRDQFELEGPNGSHRCFVTSPARCSLDDAQDSDCFPLETARVLVAQSLMVVAYIHSRGSCLATRDDILSQHVDTLGLPSFPSSWWNEWETRHDYFEPGLGQLSVTSRDIRPPLERAFEEKIQAWRRRVRMGEFDQDEATAILAMLRGMLVFAPDERATAKSLLASQWMLNWGYPALYRARLV